MSLKRLVFYCAIVGGWAGLVGSLLAEFLVKRPGLLGGGTADDVATAALVGAAIGAGLNLVAGTANAQWQEQLKRLAPGLLIGGVSGAVGSLIGNFLYQHGLPRGIGWFVMGVSIGAVDGLSERSWKKVRNGLIGGALGGLLGGFLFEPIKDLAGSRAVASMSSAFVLLGLCIGALIGLVQVVLKEAWLSVVDGYRPGRQLILSRDVTTLGRAENATLPFFGPTARDVEKQHASIVRQPNGQFVIEDHQGKGGTRVNNEVVQGTRVLRNGDLIRLGGNIVRFNERARSAAPAPVAAPAAAPAPRAVPAPRPAPPVAVPAAKPPSNVATLVGGTPPSPPPSQGAPPAKPRAADECPTCGRKVPGPPGRRRCVFDGTTF